jgi:hypothetical protein
MRVRYSALLLLLCCAWPSVAGAGIPNPPNCDFPYRVLACPAGDVQLEVVVRDVAHLEISGSTVVLGFSTCPAVAFCDDCCPGVILDRQARTATAITDAHGAATFSLKMGGLCPAGTVEVRADGFLLGLCLVSSPDQNGDLLVNAADTTIVHDQIGTQIGGAGSDLDGDGEVTEADVSWLTDLHGGHSCAGVVPTRKTTWGSVKLLYR